MCKMRWLVTNLSNFIYLFRGRCLFWGFLGFLILSRTSKLPTGIESFSRFLGGERVCVSDLQVTVTCRWHQHCCCLLAAFSSSSSLFLCLFPRFFSSAAVWPWAVVTHGTALGLSFRSSCFLLVRPRGFQCLQSFQVFLSERQKLMWRSCPDLWESAAQQ